MIRIAITGSPGSGKSTVCRNVLKRLTCTYGGMTSADIREKGDFLLSSGTKKTTERTEDTENYYNSVISASSVVDYLTWIIYTVLSKKA